MSAVHLDLSGIPLPQATAQAVETLRAGGLVIFPTETVYGAGVDATNPQAVDKLLKFKSRREGKPLSIAVTDLAMAEQYVEVNESAKQLYARFLPGPMTVVSTGRHLVAPGVESEYGSLGVRIPDYPLVLDMVRALGKPITATSANGSGQKRPYTIADVESGLSGAQLALVDLILDAGTLPTRPPSTVVDTTLSAPVVFRQGDIAVPTVSATSNGERTILQSRSADETRDIAQRLMLKYWEKLKSGGVLISLHGSLGAGKTTFTQGIGKFLQLSEPITSPTYSYVESYDFTRHGVSGKLNHLDLWKVSSPDEFARLGLDELIGPHTLTVLEWASTLPGLADEIAKKHQLVHLVITLTEPTVAEPTAAEHTAAEPSAEHGAVPNARTLTIQEVLPSSHA